MTDQIIQDHLMGKLTADVYPLLADETCWFLAADFDKTTWQEDVRAYLPCLSLLTLTFLNALLREGLQHF